MAPQAYGRSLCNLSNTSSRMLRQDGRPGSRRVSSERSTLPPELPRSPNHRRDIQYPPPPTPPLQGSSSVLPSPYAPGLTQQDLESQTWQHTAASPISNHYSLPSGYFEAFTPSDRHISRQRYGGGGTSASFRGVEDSISHQGRHTHTGYGSPLTSMDDASFVQNFQEPFMEPYNPSAEQSNEQGPIVLSEMGSWESRRVPDETNVSDIHHRSDDSRFPFHRRSATDQREGLTVNPNHLSNSGPVETNPVRQDLGTHSQEIGYPFDKSALGIDWNLQPPYFSEAHGSFVEDANNTNTNAGDSQNEGYPHDPGYLGNHYTSNQSALALWYAPESGNILSSTTSNLTPPSDRGAHRQPAPESSERCEICRLDFSNSENRRRHMREQHKDNFHHECRLSKGSLACGEMIKVARNRRKHVEAVHPGAAKLLPQPSTNRRSNNETDKLLNGWFNRVPKPSAQ